MRIDDEVAPLNRTYKILGVTLDTQFTFDPRSRSQLCRASFGGGGALRYECLSWDELEFSNRILGGDMM